MKTCVVSLAIVYVMSLSGLATAQTGGVPDPKPQDPLRGTVIKHEGPYIQGQHWVVKVCGKVYGVGEIDRDKQLVLSACNTSAALLMIHVFDCPDLAGKTDVRFLDGLTALRMTNVIHEGCAVFERLPPNPDSTFNYCISSRINGTPTPPNRTPVNISKFCPPDQVAFVATLLYYEEAYSKAEAAGENDVRLSMITQQCDRAIAPYLQRDVINWVGSAWPSVEGGGKPNVSVTDLGYANFMLTVSAFPETSAGIAEPDKTISYDGSDGTSHSVTSADGGPIIFQSVPIAPSSPAFTGLSDVKLAGQLIRFSGKFSSVHTSSPWVWWEEKDRVTTPSFRFDFSQILLLKK